MTHTLWHCGVLIGEADLEPNPARRQQVAGIFRPTAYGRELLPRLTGLLSVAATMKRDMRASGLTEEATMDSDNVSEFLESTPAGRKAVDIGRTLSEVELRDHAGATLDFDSIAFLDIAELKSVARMLEGDADGDLDTLRSDGPIVLVSATLARRPRPPVASARVDLS